MIKKNIFLLLFISFSATFAQVTISSKAVVLEESKSLKLREKFDDYKIVDVSLDEFKKMVDSKNETSITWKIDEKTTWAMQLYPNDLRSSGYQEAIVTDDGITVLQNREITTYKGYIIEGKEIRLTIDDNFIQGIVETDEGTMVVDQLTYILKDKSIAPNHVIIYPMDKVKEEAAGICLVPDEPRIMGMERDISESSRSSSSTNCKILEVAIDCDFEYWDFYGTGSLNRMLSTMNIVQQTYERDLNTILNITASYIFTSASIYSSTNYLGIIQEIQNIWTTFPYNTIPKDVSHHFVGLNIDDEGNSLILGHASGLGDACNATLPASFSRDYDQNWHTVSHEIGHLLNARHSDGTSCNINMRTIMCPGEFTSTNTFSSSAINRITNFMNNENCFNFNSITISGENNMCLNQTKTYDLTNFDGTPASIFGDPGTTVTWSTDSRLTILSGQGTESVLVRGSGEGQGVLTAIINYPGSCGLVTETKNIAVGPTFAISLSISGPATDGWITATVSGGTAPYSWTLNSSTTWTTNTPYTTRYVGCNGAYLLVQTQNSCGTGTASQYIYPCSGGYYRTSVYPNPTTYEINVVETEEYKTSENYISILEDMITLDLLDFSGNTVKLKQMDGRTEALKLDVNGLPKGNYFLVIKGEKIEEAHQIIVE